MNKELHSVILAELKKHEVTHIVTNGAIGTAIQSFIDFDEDIDDDIKVGIEETYKVGYFQNVEIRIDPNRKWDDREISLMTILTSSIEITEELNKKLK